MGACKRKRRISKKYNLRKGVKGREKTPEGIRFSVLLAKHRSHNREPASELGLYVYYRKFDAELHVKLSNRNAISHGRYKIVTPFKSVMKFLTMY